MGDLDPVEWDEVLAVVGPPAPVVEERVAELGPDLRGEDPYEAVKAVHDALASDPDAAPTPPDQAEVEITTYLLEKRGVVAFESEDASVLARRPDPDRLRELSWDPPRTMWWLGVRLGVHWATVRYWLYEDGIPLKERNFGAETMAAVREHRGE